MGRASVPAKLCDSALDLQPCTRSLAQRCAFLPSDKQTQSFARVVPPSFGLAPDACRGSLSTSTTSGHERQLYCLAHIVTFTAALWSLEPVSWGIAVPVNIAGRCRSGFHARRGTCIPGHYQERQVDVGLATPHEPSMEPATI